MKIVRVLIVMALIFEMATANANAESPFSTYLYPDKEKNFIGISNSENRKTENENKWYVKPSTIIYNPSSAYVGLGVCFSPMVADTPGVYRLCGGSYQWVKSASSNPYYGTWDQGYSLRYYYLGARLDTLFSGSNAYVAGAWNAW